VLKEGEKVPEMFEDPVVKRASYWILSTSAVFSKHLREYGWGEVWPFSLSIAYQLTSAHAYKVVPNGFGVAYITGFDGMSTCGVIITRSS
jgi:carnitine O-acetyltransferase